MLPRNHRDRQPHAYAAGRRRRRRIVREQSVEHAGRRCGRLGGRVRNPHVFDQRREQRHVLQAHPRSHRPRTTHHDRRRRRSCDRHPHGTNRLARKRARRYRGDDDRRHPTEQHGASWNARIPCHSSQRRGDQALLRQPIRYGTEHVGRHHPRYERPACGKAGSDCGVRVVRQGSCNASQGNGRPYHRDRGQPNPRARGSHGRPSSDANERRGKDRRYLHNAYRQHAHYRQEPLASAERRSDRRK